MTFPMRAAKTLAYMGGAVLIIVLMLLMVVDVAMRAFGLGVPASVDLVTLGTRLCFGLALPYTTITGGHVAMDALTNLVSPAWRRVWATFSAAIGTTVMAFGAWAVTRRALASISSGEQMTTLSLPFWPNYVPIIVGFALSALLCLMALFDLLRSGLSGKAGTESN